MLEFKPITIDDLKLLNPFLKEFSSSSCQHSFAAMLGLTDKYGDEYCFIDDVLFIHRSHQDHDGYRVYLAPLGNLSTSISKYVQMIFDDAHDYGLKASFETVTEEFKNLLIDNFDSNLFDIEYNRDYSEYIYTVEGLSVLPGRDLAAKRNRVRAFYSAYEGHIEIKDITPSNISDVKEFTKVWIKERMESLDDPGLESESKAISIYLNNFEALNFRGIVVYLYGKVAGYAAGVPISSDTIDEVIEKGLRDVTGIYQLLCNEFANICCKDFAYINREEDVGLEGLRRAKESYKPYKLLNKYMIKEK